MAPCRPTPLLAALLLAGALAAASAHAAARNDPAVDAAAAKAKPRDSGYLAPDFYPSRSNPVPPPPPPKNPTAVPGKAPSDIPKEDKLLSMLPPNLPPDSTLLVSGEKAAAHADTMHDTIYKTIEKICKSETCEKRMHTVIAEQRGAGDPFNSEKNAQEIIDRVLKAEGHIW